jgi:predicted MFS family arabinose efflux permease
VNFGAVALLAAIACGGLWLGIPRQAGQNLATASLAERVAVIRQPGVLPALTVTSLWALGCYTVYTFIAPYLGGVAHLDGSQISYVLFGWGVCAVAGIFLGGVGNDKLGARTVIQLALPLLALSLAGLSIAQSAPLVLVAMALWGVSAWGFFPAQQARMINIAGLKNASIVLSLNASFQYFGFAMGALLGALTLSAGGAANLGWVGALCVLAALTVFTVSTRVKKRNDAVARMLATEL